MVALLAAPPMCPPRYATARTNRPTLGPAVGRVAAMLGKPFMPWQQYVADVALEIDSTTRRLVYREVRLTVPRQSGKTTLILALAVHRAMAAKQFGPRNKIVYTAQTRKDARKKFVEDFLEDMKVSKPLAGQWRDRLSNGDEHVLFHKSRARFGIDATTEKSGHGGTLDLAFIDEAFAQVDARSEQAFKPAMITRNQAQLWVVSTAGWLGGSPYLAGKVRSGRELVEAGVDASVAYFEWSAPEDADPTDPATWWGCMPAMGHTVTEDTIAAELVNAAGVNDFTRPYLNWWVPKDAPPEQVIPAVKWAARKDRVSTLTGKPVLVFDANPERSSASIAVVGWSGPNVHVEIADWRPGLSWLAPRVAEIAADLGLSEVAVDSKSPATSEIPALIKAGLVVNETGPADMSRGCGSFYDLATEGGLVHLGQPELDAALASAKKRTILGDGFGWDRRDFTDISPLVAVSLGVGLLAAHVEVPKSGLPRNVTTTKTDRHSPAVLRW